MVDEKILVNGSANWTRSAFSRNGDCFLILHDLDDEQRKKMKKLWHVIRSTSDLTPDETAGLFSKIRDKVTSLVLPKVNLGLIKLQST